jgi:release factor glutamine methyltransferase
MRAHAAAAQPATVAVLLAASALPIAEARALLAEVLGVRREWLIAHPDHAVEAAAAASFTELAARRRGGVPLAYLLARREFYGRAFRVTPAVLVPRPETELLVDLAVDALRSLEAPRVLDLGTGSGCIAITLALARPDAEVVAVDRSAAALAVAQDNAATLGAQAAFIESDWYGAVNGRFDLIVANPPYIAAGDPHLAALAHEPQHALTDGGDGLACLRVIVREAPVHLRPRGVLMVEHGHDQGAAVRALLAAAGFAEVRTERDAAGNERVGSGRSAPAARQCSGARAS